MTAKLIRAKAFKVLRTAWQQRKDVQTPARTRKAEACELTDFAIIVQERRDGSMALLVKVSHAYPRRREEKSVFTITDRLDPRLEEYLRELADAERARRLSAGRAIRKKTKRDLPRAQLMLL